jgi:hypothetical protein
MVNINRQFHTLSRNFVFKFSRENLIKSRTCFKVCVLGGFFARLAGLEPATLGSGGPRSIQLSYRRVFTIIRNPNKKFKKRKIVESPAVLGYKFWVFFREPSEKVNNNNIEN